VLDLLRRADPEGVQDVAPPDEYDAPARDLARRLLRGESMSDWVNRWRAWSGAMSRQDMVTELERLQATLRA
jgi:hypothetical protein